MSIKLSRQAYAKKYGPTVGDRVRLADTELIIEIEKDYTDYGEESIFGGGKSGYTHQKAPELWGES